MKKRLGGMKMEYTKEGLLKLELTNERRKNRGIINKVYKHKWISMIVVTLVLLSSINIIMIYNFFKILQNI